jgi:hypothetical protein
VRKGYSGVADGERAGRDGPSRRHATLGPAHTHHRTSEPRPYMEGWYTRTDGSDAREATALEGSRPAHQHGQRVSGACSEHSSRLKDVVRF